MEIFQSDLMSPSHRAAEVPAFSSYFQFLQSASGVLPETQPQHLQPWKEFLQLGQYATHVSMALM